MDAPPPIPKPGDLLGWVIRFGPKQELEAWVKALDGETAALLKASHLENAVILRAVVG
jgi:hypothetical protein